jgi:thioredoxin-related protein
MSTKKRETQMKNIVLLLTLPAILLTAGGLKKSLLQSKREQKPLMVLVTSESCRYCDKMKKNTLSDEQVKESLDGFLFTTVQKSSVEARRYFGKTRYTPTVYFVSSAFSIVNTVSGYLGPKDFNKWVKDTRVKLGMSSVETQSQGHEEEIVSYVQPEKDSRWMYDIASAMDFASQTGKHLMIFVGSTKSKYSKKMESETLKNREIKEALNDFVWVKLNYGDAETKAYNLTSKALPTVYFMRSDMNELAIAKGYYSSEKFMAWIKYAKSKI